MSSSTEKSFETEYIFAKKMLAEKDTLYLQGKKKEFQIEMDIYFSSFEFCSRIFCHGNIRQQKNYFI